MSNDVLITPASRKIEFKDSSANIDAVIETDASGNLNITNAGGDIQIGDTSTDVYIGDGVANVDIIYEQSGEIRAVAGQTLTLGGTGSLSLGSDLNINSKSLTGIGNLSIGTGTDSSKITFPDKDILDDPTAASDKRQLIAMGNSGLGGMWQTTGRGGLMLASADDSLILASGDLGRNFDPNAGGWNPNSDDENIYLLTDGGVEIRTNLQTVAEYKSFAFNTAGTLTVPTNITVGGTVDGVDIAARDAVLTTTTTTANAAYGWGNHASAGYITGNQTITLSGDVSGSGTTSISVTVNDDSHFHHRLDSTDDRDMKPSTSGIATSVQALKPFFSSYGGMTGTANTTYVDVLAFDTYSDSSGGGPSAITFKKGNSAGNPEMHIWKAGWNATTWSTGQRVYADNYHPNADTLTTARTINGVSFNGSANITVADSTKLPLAGGTMTGALVGTTGTFSKDAVAGTNALNILGVNNGSGTGITFSDNGTPAVSASGQNGYMYYYHGDSLSYGSGNAFILSSSETTTTILADGKLMYKEGIYSKPASGTGAGTRKDANWDTAYGWGDHSTAGYGDITAVVAGTGLSGGATSGSATLNIDWKTNETFTGTYPVVWNANNDPYTVSWFTVNGATDTVTAPNLAATEIAYAQNIGHAQQDILFAITDHDTTESIRNKFETTGFLSKVDDSTAPASGVFECTGYLSNTFGPLIPISDDTEIMFETWVKYESGGDSTGDLYVGGQFYNGSKTDLGNNNRYWGANGDNFDSNEPAPAGEWHHIKGILKGSVIRAETATATAEYVKLLVLLNYNAAANTTRYCGFRFYQGRKTVSSLYHKRHNFSGVYGDTNFTQTYDSPSATYGAVEILDSKGALKNIRTITSFSSDANYAGDFTGAPQPQGPSGQQSNGVYIKAGSSSNDNAFKIDNLAGSQIANINGFGQLTLAGSISASGYNSGNWNTAYGWGDHSTAGYVTSSAASFESLRIASGGTTSDTQEGKEYKYYLVGMGLTDGNWKKVCDVTVATGLYKALTMNITLESQNSNFGSSNATHTSHFSALYYRTGGTQDDQNNANLAGQNTDNHELRILKTATGVYELQIKMLQNYKDAIVKIEVLSTNGGSVSVPSSITNGSTTGTAYTAAYTFGLAKSIYNDIDARSISVSHNNTLTLGDTVDGRMTFKVGGFASSPSGVASLSCTNGSSTDISTLQIELGGANLNISNSLSSMLVFEHDTGNLEVKTGDLIINGKMSHFADSNNYIEFGTDTLSVYNAGQQILSTNSTDINILKTLDLDPADNTPAIDARVDITTANTARDGIKLDMNISGSIPTSADVIHAGINVDLDSSYTGGDTSNEGRLYGVYATSTSSGDNDLVYGGRFLAQTSGTASGVATNTTIVCGVEGYADQNRSTRNTNQYGVRGLSYTDNAGSSSNTNVSNSYGVYGLHVQSTGGTSGITTSAYGLFGEVQSDEGSVTNGYGCRTLLDRNNGTITNGYLFYGSYSGATVNKWGLFIDGADKNRIAGLIELAEGTAAQPTLVNVSNTDTGIYFDDDQVNISRNGELVTMARGYDFVQESSIKAVSDISNMSGTGTILLSCVSTTNSALNSYSGSGVAMPLKFSFGQSGDGVEFARNTQEFKGQIQAYKTAATTSDANATIISKGTVDTTTGNQPQNWHIAFQDGGGTVRGKITSSHYSTQYSTSSDYRLKEDIQPISNATERLLAINAVNFRWIDGQERSDGFIAHELQEHLPEAVTGEKDATTEVTETVVADDGTETEVTATVPEMQGIDQSKLVPLLVKTIQELEARITALENA